METLKEEQRMAVAFAEQAIHQDYISLFQKEDLVDTSKGRERLNSTSKGFLGSIRGLPGEWFSLLGSWVVSSILVDSVLSVSSKTFSTALVVNFSRSMEIAACGCLAICAMRFYMTTFVDRLYDMEQGSEFKL